MAAADVPPQRNPFLSAPSKSDARNADHLARSLAWFAAHLDDVPLRLHRHGVWTDPDDGAGSALGSPALDRRWEHWLEAASGTVTVIETILCYHVGRPKGTICEVCALRDAEGQPIAESGLRHSEREVYRYPMHAAIASFGQAGFQSDRPGLALTLTTLARAGGDAVSAAETLARRWPKMGDPQTARGHFRFALERLRKRWPQYDPRPLAGAA